MTQQPDEQREPVRFKGPGQWRSASEQLQPGLTPEQEAEIEQAARDCGELSC